MGARDALKGMHTRLELPVFMSRTHTMHLSPAEKPWRAFDFVENLTFSLKEDKRQVLRITRVPPVCV
jgi:hypothetical protein